jgi:hypothetical protein
MQRNIDKNINKIKPIEKEISLYNLINSKKKNIYHIKSISDITTKRTLIIID